MNEAKMWWASKTIWTNLIALIGAVVVAWGLDPGRWAEISTVVLAVVNLALRLVTNEPIAIVNEK